MKKALLTGLLASAAMFVAATDTRAQSDHAAQIVKDVGCFLSSSASGLSVDLFTNQTIDVATQGGNVTLQCHFDIPQGYEPPKAIVNRGFLCGVIGFNEAFELTNISQAVSSPGGKADLRCQVKASKL